MIHIYSLFKEYCGMAPRIKKSHKSGTYKEIYVDTLTYPAFNKFQDMFYKDKVKVVPSKIEELMTARGLAYWYMDDGTSDRSGYVLDTDSFTKEDVELLGRVLKNK